MPIDARNARVNISTIAHEAAHILARRHGIKKGDVVEILIASALFQNFPNLAEELDKDGALALAANYPQFEVEVKIKRAKG